MTEITILIKSFLTLAIICFIIFYGLKLLQKYTKFGNISDNDNEDAVKINSITYIDQNSKIVKFTSNNKVHLILLGSKNDLLIDKYEIKRD